MAENLGRNLIFIVTFLSSFILLLGIMPSGFSYSGKSYSNYTYPDYFDKSDVEHIAFFENGTLTRGVTPLTLDFNPDVNMKFYIFWFVIGDNIQFQHITWEWFIFHTAHYMDIEEAGLALSKNETLSNWESDFNASILYPVECNHVTVKVWLTDSNSSRNDIGEAWDDGEIDVSMGFGFDDIRTTFNAWDIVGRLLMFQAVEIGIPLFINIILVMPIWASIGYLIYRLILLAIPFVG